MGANTGVLETGSLGESYWVGPTASKYEITRERCTSGPANTEITFCRTRVDERTFRPLTREPSEREQSYALLKFGERCPPQSLEVSKFLYTEELDEPVNSNSFSGEAFPTAPIR